ncbi:DUF6893 family small protein [Streptomyces sp. NPDC054840]
MKKALIGGAAVAALTAVLLLPVLPDLRRYLRMRRM